MDNNTNKVLVSIISEAFKKAVEKRQEEMKAQVPKPTNTTNAPTYLLTNGLIYDNKKP